MKKIKLSQRGKLAGQYVALVDDSDFERLNKFAWSVMCSGERIYAVRSTLTDNGQRRLIYMQREVLGAPDNCEVEYRSDNRLDNRRANLQIITRSQSRQRRHHAKSRSGYRGVRQTGWRSFTALITQERRTVTIGVYPTSLDAARAYDDKAREMFGPLAVTNF